MPRTWRALAWILGLGLAALPLVQARGLLWQAHTVPKMVLVRLLASAVLVLGGILLVRARVPFRLSWTALAALGFLAWTGLTALLGVGVHQSILGGVHRYEGWVGVLAYVVVFLSARALAERTGTPPRAVGVVAWSVGVVVGVIGVAQAVWPVGHPVRWLALEALDRSASTFGNPIYLGLFAALVLPFGLAVAAAEERPAVRFGGAAGLGVLAAAGYLTYSRGAWLGAVVGGLVLLACHRERRRLAGPALVTAAVALVVAAGAARAHDVVGPGGEALTAESRIEETFAGGGTVGTRIELYKGALRLVGERPFLGWGLETYPAQGARVRTLRLVQLESPSAFPDRPHNPQLYVAYAAGLPGLGLYAVLILGALAGGIAQVRRSSPREAAVAAGLLAGCVGYLAAESTSFSVVEATPLFWAALGWVSAAPGGRGITVPRNVGRAAGAALLVLLVPGLYVVTGHAVAVARADNIHHGLVTGVQDPSRYRELERREAEATALDPFTPFYWNARALILSRAWSAGGGPELLEEAQEILASGLERTPGDPTLTVTLSDIQMKAGRPHDAIRLLEAYLRIDPFLEDARFNLALAYLDVGDPARAVAELQEAVAIVPTDAEAFWYLARALEAVGESADAESARARALELDPSLEPGS